MTLAFSMTYLSADGHCAVRSVAFAWRGTGDISRKCAHLVTNGSERFTLVGRKVDRQGGAERVSKRSRRAWREGARDRRGISI